MRIILGKFKGKKIKMPRGIRPTQNKVRKAIFDIIRDIKGRSFLDLYAGSGAIGLEALSCGALRVVFVESQRRCLVKLKDNLASVGMRLKTSSAAKRNQEASCQILEQDAIMAIKQLSRRNEKFDFVFLDPPYQQNLVKKTLKALSRYDIVAPSGLIICQHSKREILLQAEDDLSLLKQAKYGSTILSFYKKKIA